MILIIKILYLFRVALMVELKFVKMLFHSMSHKFLLLEYTEAVVDIESDRIVICQQIWRINSLKEKLLQILWDWIRIGFDRINGSHILFLKCL